MDHDAKSEADRYFTKGRTAREAGRYKTALNWFVKAAQCSKGPGRGNCWLMAAYCEELRGNLTEAMVFLRKAERCHPKSARIQTYIGRIQTELGRPKLAARAFRKSIDLKPSTIAYTLLGVCIGRQGCFEESGECFQAAIELDPDYEEAHYNLGVFYAFDGQDDKAEKHLRRATELDPHYAMAHTELGSILINKGLYREARKHLRRSVKFEPDRVWSRLRLAIANWFLRRLKEAEEQYLEALRIAPNSAYSNAVLGDFLSAERRGDPDFYLAKALSLEPHGESVLYFMGKHLRRQGRDPEAKVYLKKAAGKGHDGARKRLEELVAENC